MSSGYACDARMWGDYPRLPHFNGFPKTKTLISAAQIVSARLECNARMEKISLTV